MPAEPPSPAGTGEYDRWRARRDLLATTVRTAAGAVPVARAAAHGARPGRQLPRLRAGLGPVHGPGRDAARAGPDRRRARGRALPGVGDRRGACRAGRNPGARGDRRPRAVRPRPDGGRPAAAAVPAPSLPGDGRALRAAPGPARAAARRPVRRRGVDHQRRSCGRPSPRSPASRSGSSPSPSTPPTTPPGALRARLGLGDEYLFAYQFDLASSGERKNPAAVLRAYLRAFPDPGPEVRLLLKARPRREQPARLGATCSAWPPAGPTSCSSTPSGRARSSTPSSSTSTATSRCTAPRATG